MSFVPAICTQCGASLQVNDTQDAAICPFCNTPFVVQKAINKYYNTYNINAGVVNITSSVPSLDELFSSARALLLQGAFMHDKYTLGNETEEDEALRGMFLKMLGIEPDGIKARIVKVASEINRRCRTTHFDYQTVFDNLHMLRTEDPELYNHMLKKCNARFKRSITGIPYSGGLLGLKLLDVQYRESIDSYLIKEEGRDDLFLLDFLYFLASSAHRHQSKDAPYVCQKIFDELPPFYKQLIATEFQRRESISNSVLNALSAGDNRRAYEILSSAVPFYPQCEQLLSCFEKTIFSMKCKLSFSPQMMQSKYYAPTVIPEAMSYCPSFVETLKSLQKR